MAVTVRPGFLAHDYDLSSRQVCKRCGATLYEVEDNLKPRECQPIAGDADPAAVGAQFDADGEAVNAAWLALRDAVLARYDRWSASSAETRRLREVAEAICGIPKEYVNTVCHNYRGSVAEVVQPYRKPHDALIALQRGPMAPAWASWISEARDLIEIVEKTAQ